MVRRVDPSNRRCKTVSLTDAGRAMVCEIDAVHDPAPVGVADLAPDELAVLRRLVDRMKG